MHVLETGMSWRGVLKLVSNIDAEALHDASLAFIKLHNKIPIVRKSEVVRPITVFGIEFMNFVGLAAGFDKNSEIVEYLPGFGFGFAEIGTVTPRPQPGNDRPRLFRDYEKQILFNRMGFNNDGAEVVSRRLRKAKTTLPQSFRVGVNVGKNKETTNDDAHFDYAKAVSYFEGLTDYLVINVSSPNTMGLRDLQNRESLNRILESVFAVVDKWSVPPPVLVKLAPELNEEAQGSIVEELEKSGIAGLVLTNTLKGSWKIDNEMIEGGLSGRPLVEPSERALVSYRKKTDLPIISVGGIIDLEVAQRRLDLGASLLQIYSGWVFSGPDFPRLISVNLEKDRTNT